MKPEQLQPTLWRTCRVLASDTRLRLFAQLLRKQPQSVSQLAELAAVPLPVASQSLRALESRGLLRVRRFRRRVEYRIPSAAEAEPLGCLVEALQACLGREPMPIEQVIKLATAFTHPSRIGIYRALKSGQKSWIQIQAAIRLSSPALSRHLGKLVGRGYVTLDDIGIYSIVRHPHRTGRALADLAGA
jgi:DNA-binding transcriptional ArsR family regulator